jgi:hypothetical protein
MIFSASQLVVLCVTLLLLLLLLVRCFCSHLMYVRTYECALQAVLPQGKLTMRERLAAKAHKQEMLRHSIIVAGSIPAVAEVISTQ